MSFEKIGTIATIIGTVIAVLWYLGIKPNLSEESTTPQENKLINEPSSSQKTNGQPATLSDPPKQSCRDGMISVPAKNYATKQFPLGADYLHALGIEDRVYIEKTFYIDPDEVTIEEFNAFFQTLAPEERAKFGLDADWENEMKPNQAPYRLLHGISWQAASAYAKWKGKKDGCVLALPSATEWVAAVLYAKDLSDEKFLKNLLSEPSEWSRSSCHGSPEKHWLLGIPKGVSREDPGKPSCPPDMKLDWAGLRFVFHGNENDSK